MTTSSTATRRPLASTASRNLPTRSLACHHPPVGGGARGYVFKTAPVLKLAVST
jgi:hypothetical protein